MARSLFVASLQATVAAGAVVSALLLLKSNEGGVAVAVVTIAWMPILLLVGISLSTRATRQQRRRPWVGLLAAIAVGIVFVWPLTEPAEAPHTPILDQAAGLTFWLAPLLIVVAAICAGLLGYGERGALESHARDNAL
jgi:hypothetical protein